MIHAQGLAGLKHDVSTAHFIQEKWLESLAERSISSGKAGFLWRNVCIPLERYALGPHCSSRVIAISGGVQRDLAGVYGIKEGVRLVYHGVDLERFNPINKSKWKNLVREELGISSENFLAIFVGNLQKGAVAALKAVSLVDNIHIAFLSNSPNQKERKLAEDLGICKRVHWAGFSKQVERFFAAADCFVFPTLYEPFGMVISEAMASGLPVITSATAGAAELIEHGVSGWLTKDPWGIEEIAEGLRYYSDNRRISIETGIKARSAIEAFTWDRCARETMEVYKEIKNLKDTRLLTKSKNPK